MTGWELESADPNRPFVNKGNWQYDFEIDSADPLTGIVSGFASIEGIDKAGDMITMEAFQKALARLKDDGVDLPLAYGHKDGINVGKVTDAAFLMDSNPRKFWIQGKINKSKAGKAAMDGIVKGRNPDYKGEDAIRAFSIGGSALSKVRYCSQSGMCFNKIDDLELYHVGLVFNPMNTGSLIMAIKGCLPEIRKVDYPKASEAASEGSIIPDGDGVNKGSDEKEIVLNDSVIAASLKKKGWSVIPPPDLLMKPMGDYADFADCVSKNHDKENPEAYCGAIKHQIEGKGELKMPEEKKPDMQKEQKEPVAAVVQAAASPTQPPTPPAQPAAPAIDYKAKYEEVEAKNRELTMKMEAIEAEKKLNAKAEAAPAAQAPAVAMGQQPDRKGVVQSSGPLAGQSAGVSVMEMARDLNEKKAPLVPDN